MASDMVLMPNISTAKPRSMDPTSFSRSDRVNICKTAPTKASTGTKLSGFISRSNRELPEMSFSASSQAVAVVPMLAPRITLMECSRDMIPALTKPSTMTVVAPED